MTSCYFALTTLATVGYGDYYPISWIEKIFAVLVMLLGVAFFSYIIGNFIEIFSTYQSKVGVVDRREDLNKWLQSLQRFKNRTPLAKSLQMQIERDFNYFWQYDKMQTFNTND